MKQEKLNIGIILDVYTNGSRRVDKIYQSILKLNDTYFDDHHRFEARDKVLIDAMGIIVLQSHNFIIKLNIALSTYLHLCNLPDDITLEQMLYFKRMMGVMFSNTINDLQSNRSLMDLLRNIESQST